MRTLDTCPDPQLLLSFDFDGTLHNPADPEPVPSAFFETIRKLRQNRSAVWGINTGRSMPQVIDGMIESQFPFLPDWVIAREREIYFPNEVGRFLPHAEWNDRCAKEITKLFKKSGKILDKIRHEIEEHTGAKYVEMQGEPAGLISRTEEEMEWIVAHIAPLMAEVPELGWQRNSIYLRFGHTGYQKGTALSEVGRLLNISVEQTCAVGDSHNDVEMLSETHCGFAACPANAVEDIRIDIRARTNGLITKQPCGLGVVEALETFFAENR